MNKRSMELEAARGASELEMQRREMKVSSGGRGCGVDGGRWGCDWAGRISFVHKTTGLQCRLQALHRIIICKCSLHCHKSYMMMKQLDSISAMSLRVLVL